MVLIAAALAGFSPWLHDLVIDYYPYLITIFGRLHVIGGMRQREVAGEGVL